MTTLSSVTVPLPTTINGNSFVKQQPPQKKEERVIFLLQEEGVEAIQTTSTTCHHHHYFEEFNKEPTAAAEATTTTNRSSLIEKYQRYNQYQRRTSGPTFSQRAKAVARLFHQHLLLHKRTDETALLEELIHQFSEYWIQTADELALPPLEEAPLEQIQFGMLVHKKRFTAILNEIGSLYEKENTFEGCDITFDNHSIRLEFLRVIHGYYRLRSNNNGVTTNDPTTTNTSSTNTNTTITTNVSTPTAASSSTLALPLETPAMLEYALLLGRTNDDTTSTSSSNTANNEDLNLQHHPNNDEDQISAISVGTGTGTGTCDATTTSLLPSSIKIPDHGDDANNNNNPADSNSDSNDNAAAEEAEADDKKLLNSDPRILDLILHIAIKALPSACNSSGSSENSCDDDPSLSQCHLLSSSSCAWFPTRLKLETIMFAVEVLQSEETHTSLKRNACHLLLVATTLPGITCGVFEGLEVVSTLTNLLRRRKDSGPVSPCGFRKEASEALKAILALPATI